MDILIEDLEIIDNGGSRSGRDRRRFTIIDYNPERRTGKERRNGIDRRKDQMYRGDLAIERREKFKGPNF